MRTARNETILLALTMTIAAGLAGPASAADAPSLKDVIRAEAATAAVGAAPSEAATATGEAGGEAPAEAGRTDVLGRSTPQGAVRGYLDAVRAGDYPKAAEYLEVPPNAAQDPAGLARRFQVVLDQTLWVDVSALSDRPEGWADDGLPPQQDKIGEIASQRGPVPVLLDRQPEDGVPIWRFSQRTLARVPELYEQYGYGPLGAWLPDFFFEVRLLEVQLWQWVALMALVVVAAALSWGLASVVTAVLRGALRRTAGELGRGVVELAAGPLRLAIAVLLFSAGKYFLNLAVPVIAVLSAIESGLLIFAATWVLLRGIDFGSRLAERTLQESAQLAAVTLVRPGRKAVKLFVLVIAVLAALDSFGFDVTAVLAGLGIGGIAVALAAQKSVENLFGGITLYADQPVRVGDFCRFGDRIGTVEDIGLRSTRVRTLDRTLVTVPNAEFANFSLENFARRDRIWYHPTLGLRYETTPDQLRYILVEVRKLLYAHPKVNPDPARIRFTSFGAYSLDLEVFAYIDVTDYGEFLEVSEDLNLRIMDIVEEAGSGFAFPSQTTYLEQGSGVDGERARAAEQQVERWRQEQALFLPRFPQQKISELAGSIEYPPRGAPTARS